MADKMFRWLLIGALFVLCTVAANEQIFHISAGGFEAFLRQYQGIVTSLGTLITIGLLAVLTTVISNQSAERRERYSRKIETEMQIATFRQQWIDELRKDISEHKAICLVTKLALENGGAPAEKMYKLAELANRITLRMNPLDPDYEELKRTLILDRERIADTGGDADINSYITLSLAQRILKREWDRLKDDLRSDVGAGSITR